jgi:quercetin dioxygenase-like cupin family protein
MRENQIVPGWHTQSWIFLIRTGGRTLFGDAGSIVKTDEPQSQVPEPGMVRQVLAHSPHLMLVRHHFAPDWVGARHSHPHHQLVYVVKGAIRVDVGGATFDVHAGDSFVVDGGVEHQASALEASEVLDFFTPIREDYRPR